MSTSLVSCRLSTPAEFICKFVETCVAPLILYCSPAIFPGLLKHDFALLKRSVKLISQVSGLNFSSLSNFLCERHIQAQPTLRSGVLEIISTPYTISYQRQGRTPPPEAIASCFPRRLPHIRTLSSRRQKCRAEPLLTESVLNLYVLFSLPLLYYCPSFYHLKFVEEEAENFTPLSKIKHLLTYLLTYLLT